MSNEDEKGLSEAVKNWIKKRSPGRLQNHKKYHQPGHKIICSKNLKGRLLKVVYYAESRSYWDKDHASFLYYNHNKGRLGVRKFNIPIGEIVIATGNYAKYEIKKERRENDAVEVVTTKGIGYIYRTNLIEKQKFS